jgi:carbon-monoxide dehydrogenase medium subunit
VTAEPVWLAPDTLEEALALKAEHGAAATVVAGGTFVGALMGQGLFQPELLLSLGRIAGLRGIEAGDALRLRAMTTHRDVERSTVVRNGWPVLARAFSLVACARIRNQATVGGVLADADYASDPPAMLCALGAVVLARGPRGEREIPVEELVTGYYETSLEPDELLVEVRVPPGGDRATYRKFRSRSREDRPCVAVAAVRAGGRLRVVVGAVAGTPQLLPDVCALADGVRLDEPLATEIGRLYAERIDPISDVRGSAAYRRRVIAVEVRRALVELAG